MKGDRDGKSATSGILPSAVVVNDHMYPHPCLYHVSMTPLGKKRYRDGDTYDHSRTRQFLVSLVVADLPSLSPFIS